MPVAGLMSDAGNLYVKVCGLGGDDDVCAVDGEFAVDSVADAGGEGEHRGDSGASEQDRDAGEELAAALADEGFVEEAQEH